MQQDDSDDLCARLAADVDAAFADVVRTNEALVFGVALRVVGNPAAADDVAQEAFVRAYRALKRYPSERLLSLRLRPWLARIALNLARNQLRGQPLATGLDEVGGEHATADEGPLRLVERREEQMMWARLLRALPDRYRLAVALRHVEGLSYAELSATLRRPLGSVKSDVHRGVELLRAAYEAEQRLIERKKEAV